MRSEQTKKAFIKYMEENPDERFWQSVRNFSGKTIYVGDMEDTFYWEELDE